jgi:drug/metabolite transporter superfamily protein YnfA
MQINYLEQKHVKSIFMLSLQAIIALTYVPSVPLIAFSIVAGMENNPKAQKWYGVFGGIFFFIASVTYIIFLSELLSL